MELRDKLKKLRAEKGISQKQLAEIIFVSRSAVAKWENGLGFPSEESYERLANYFGVPKDYFKTEEPEQVILEKNRTIRRRTISTSTAAAIIMVCFLSIYALQVRQSAQLNQSMREYDARIEAEFSAAKTVLCLEFQAYEYSPILSREIEQLKLAALYGYYFDGVSGGDAQWCILS